MWLRLLVGQLVQQAATQKVRSLVTDTLRGELQQAQQAEPPGPCDVAFIFALNAESGPLTDMLEGARYAQGATFVERSGTLEGRSVVIAEVGVGAEAAARGTADCLALHQPKWVVTAGFAGGLVDDLKKGHILMADEIVGMAGDSLQTGMKLAAGTSRGLHVGRLLTVDRLIREPEEKRLLAAKHGALACDMESLAVAEVCRQAGVRLLSIRVISDTVEDRLPVEIEMLLAEKSLAGRLGTAAGALLNRFSAVGDLWQLYEDALKCSQRLARFLRSTLPQLS